MALPRNLVLVRHGQSEGNLANKLSRAGDNSAFTDQFLSQHSQYWKLTDQGREEARLAGEWLRKDTAEHFPKFDRFYVSEYDRAMETAALLGIENAQWSTKISLRERDRGEIDVTPDDVLKTQYAEVLKRRDQSAFFWRPPEGESLADVDQRIRSFLVTLDREAEDQNVIVVCHGEVMWVFRFILESMSLTRFNQLDQSDDDKDKIHNCQIIWYNRDPGAYHLTGPQANYRMMRSVCPWNLSKSTNTWQLIERHKYSNEDLLTCLRGDSATVRG